MNNFRSPTSLVTITGLGDIEAELSNAEAVADVGVVTPVPVEPVEELGE
jgi:hypothetical protein